MSNSHKPFFIVQNSNFTFDLMSELNTKGNFLLKSNLGNLKCLKHITVQIKKVLKLNVKRKVTLEKQNIS